MLRNLFQFFSLVWQNFTKSNGLVKVGDLAYVLLVSFVPLLLSFVTILSLLPVSNLVLQYSEHFIFANFLPTTGEIFYNQLYNLMHSTRHFSWLSFLVLFATVFFMLKSVEKHINSTWRVENNRPLLRSFFVYGFLMLIGPVLLCIGLFVRLYLRLIWHQHSFIDTTIWYLFSYLFSVLTFMLVFQILPAKKVKFKYVLLIGIIAGSIFELAKIGFVFYANYFSTYSVIYGSLAAIPLFLLWVYISSFIFLFCAQFIYVLQEQRKKKKIAVIGHRGARGYAPENTIPAYKAALKHGVDWVDIDVVATKDKVLIAYHDLMINPDILCDNNGQYLADSKANLVTGLVAKDLEKLLIKNLAFNEIKQYQVKLNPQSEYKMWFPNQQDIPNTRISSLQEIIDYVNSIDNKVNFQIEVKNNLEYPDWSYSPQELADLVYAVIRNNNLLKRVKVQAFDWRILVALNRLEPKIRTGYLISYLFKNNWQRWFKGSLISVKASDLGILQANDSILPLIKVLGGYSFEPEDAELVYQDLLQAQQLGLKVVVWGWPEHSRSSFDPQLIAKLANWGVDGIITDFPKDLKELLHQNY